MPGIPIPYPRGGLNDNFAHTDQPPLTTRDAENERVVDPTSNRERGAQRAGLSKYCATVVGVGGKVQAIAQVMYDARATTYANASTESAGDLTVWDE